MSTYQAILLVTISLMISPAFSIIPETDFTTSLELCLDGSVKAKQNAYALGPKALTPKQKAAWEDCVYLYSLTRNALNKTLQFGKKSSKEDKQTWISGALSYLEACIDGFKEVGDATNMLSPMFNNTLYGSICNLLHLNKDYKKKKNKAPPYKKGRFPGWMSRHDRKLLQEIVPIPNIVVAKDGSGDYTTISDAIAAASKRDGSERFVILIKAGTYDEYITIATPNIMLLGDGMGVTIITGSKSVGGGTTTFRSATVGVTPKGTGFFARGLTFRNTAGPAKHQAVALRTAADHTIVYQCSMEGNQDTLYAFANRQYYRENNIYGTIDFIFGNAAAIFQNCTIYARYSPSHTVTLTAQSRTDPNQNTGFVFQDCIVTAAPDLIPELDTVKSYLGRPWKDYSRVVFMVSYIDTLINPLGWYFWDGDKSLKTLYYGEYANTGPGSSTANRVKWKGYHAITDPEVAGQFTLMNMIGADWLVGMNVPFKEGF